MNIPTLLYFGFLTYTNLIILIVIYNYTSPCLCFVPLLLTVTCCLQGSFDLLSKKNKSIKTWVVRRKGKLSCLFIDLNYVPVCLLFIIYTFLRVKKVIRVRKFWSVFGNTATQCESRSSLAEITILKYVHWERLLTNSIWRAFNL